MGTGNLHEELRVCLTSLCTYALEPSSAFSGCTNESAARQTTSHTLSRPMHGLRWAEAWLPPIPQHRGQQIRRLTFGQPRPGREAQLAQQCRLFLGGRVLAPRGLRRRSREDRRCNP